jgi:hypothetical protein
MLWLKLPLVPKTLSVYVPTGVVLAVAIVSVEEPVPVIETGLKLAVAPVGSPLTFRATTPLKLFNAVVEIV